MSDIGKRQSKCSVNVTLHQPYPRFCDNQEVVLASWGDVVVL